MKNEVLVFNNDLRDRTAIRGLNPHPKNLAVLIRCLVSIARKPSTEAQCKSESLSTVNCQLSTV